MLDKVRNVQFHSWNISSSQNHSMRLLRSWFNHLSKLIFGVGLYSSPFIIVLEDCELNSKVRIELLLPGNVTLCKRQYKSQAAADYLYEDLWIEINFSCSDAEVSNRRERKISIFNWQQQKKRTIFYTFKVFSCNFDSIDWTTSTTIFKLKRIGSLSNHNLI